jgi:hypothetical protein
VALRPIPDLDPGRETPQLEALTRSMGAPEGTRQSALLIERFTTGPLGEDVRHRSRRDIGGIEIINVSYWFLVRDTPLVAVVNASSPNVSEGEDLVALFDDIVGTLVVTPTIGESAPADG